METSRYEEAGTWSSPLVFVYLGKELPDYAMSSLRIVQETTPNKVIVLAEVPRPDNVQKEVTWTEISTFYSPEIFHAFKLEPPYSADFRDGFWLKTAERFFVLGQYMRHAQLESFFHGELDCLFFSLPDLEREIRAGGDRGIYLPRETADRCIASLIYVNDDDALAALCEVLIHDSWRGNEMDILGSLPSHEQSRFRYFPTAEALFRGTPHHRGEAWPVAPANSRFIVDGAVIGRWLFGVDPRNTRGRGTKNRLQAHKFGVPFDMPLDKVKISQNRNREWQLQVEGPSGTVFDLTTLHVHSKVHAKISPRYVRKLLVRLERGKASVIVPVQASFVLDVARRALLQIRGATASRARLVSFTHNLISADWWRGLRARIMDL